MKLPRRLICALLVCCSALWVASTKVKAPPPSGCDSSLSLSTKVVPWTEGIGDIDSRSLSPWKWKQITVKDQIPSTLWEAECSSSFCSSTIPGQKNRHDLNSVPVYQNVLILTAQNGSCCYKASYRSVAVGCTCVWANTGQN